jgi:hypothetical protein
LIKENWQGQGLISTLERGAWRCIYPEVVMLNILQVDWEQHDLER